MLSLAILLIILAARSTPKFTLLAAPAPSPLASNLFSASAP